MPDTRWIKPWLEWAKGRVIPAYEVDWVGVTDNEVIMIGFKPKRGRQEDEEVTN